MYSTLKKTAKIFGLSPCRYRHAEQLLWQKECEIDGKEMEMDRSNSTKFAFNLGGGITLPISERSYLNAEVQVYVCQR